jgi:hypothetical protein
MWLLTRATYATLAFASLSIAHGNEKSIDNDMAISMDTHPSSSAAAATASVSQNAQSESFASYFSYGQHSSTILAHIALMILSWCFVLPAGERSLDSGKF